MRCFTCITVQMIHCCI